MSGTTPEFPDITEHLARAQEALLFVETLRSQFNQDSSNEIARALRATMETFSGVSNLANGFVAICGLLAAFFEHPVLSHLTPELRAAICFQMIFRMTAGATGPAPMPPPGTQMH